MYGAMEKGEGVGWSVISGGTRHVQLPCLSMERRRARHVTCAMTTEQIQIARVKEAERERERENGVNNCRNKTSSKKGQRSVGTQTQTRRSSGCRLTCTNKVRSRFAHSNGSAARAFGATCVVAVQTARVELTITLHACLHETERKSVRVCACAF